MTGLREYVEYEVRARACNDRGVSSWSVPLPVLTRRKAVDGGCDNGLYKWTQTPTEVLMQLAVSVFPAPCQSSTTVDLFLCICTASASCCDFASAHICWFKCAKRPPPGMLVQATCTLMLQKPTHEVANTFK